MGYQVDAEKIKSASTAAKSSAAAITSQVQVMTKSLEDLQSSWTGTASAKFQSLLQEWKQAQTKVQTAIEGINLALNNAGEAYSQVETENARKFGM